MVAGRPSEFCTLRILIGNRNAKCGAIGVLVFVIAVIVIVTVQFLLISVRTPFTIPI
jgi:uncharacterized membrane protein YkgB